MSLKTRTPNGKCPVMVRLNEEDFQKLRELAFALNLTPNKYLELLLLEKLGKAKI